VADFVELGDRHRELGLALHPANPGLGADAGGKGPAVVSATRYARCFAEPRGGKWCGNSSDGDAQDAQRAVEECLLRHVVARESVLRATRGTIYARLTWMGLSRHGADRHDLLGAREFPYKSLLGDDKTLRVCKEAKKTTTTTTFMKQGNARVKTLVR